MAKKSISDVLVNFKGDHKNLDRSIGDSTSSLKKFSASAGSAIKSLTAIGVVGAAAMAGLTFVAWKVTTSFSDYGVELDKAMKITGLGAVTITEMAYAAEQEHASLEDLQTGWKRLAKSMLDANDGLAESQRTFDELGISILDNHGNLKKLDTITLEVADVFKDMTDDTKKAALAQDLFGRSGINMIPFLEMGARGIKTLGEESKDLGNVWTDDMAAAAKVFDDKLTAMRYTFKTLKWQLGNELMPEFEKIVDWFMTNKDWLISTTREIFDIDVSNFGESMIIQLDNVKNWVEENKDVLASVWDGLKIATDMTVTSIKVLYASMAEMYAFGAYLKSGGKQEEWENLQKVSAETAGLYQDIGQKPWAQDIAGAFQPTAPTERNYKKHLTAGMGPLAPFIAGAGQIAGRAARQQISVRLDGDAVTKFLSGTLITTAGHAAISGT